MERDPEGVSLAAALDPASQLSLVAHRSLDHVEGGWLVGPQHQPGDVGVDGQALPGR